MVKKYIKWVCEKCKNTILLPVNYELQDTLENTYEEIICICSGKKAEELSEDYLDYFGGAFIKFKEGKLL